MGASGRRLERVPGGLPRQSYERIDAPRLHAPLLEEPELATQHQVLSFERPPGPDREHAQTDKIRAQPQNDRQKSDHALMMP